MVSMTNADSLPGEWTHRLVHVQGQRLHVAECGQPTAPLVLFLHGATGGWFEWRRVLPLLADAPIHAVAASLRGYGQSDRTPQGYTPAGAAADTAGLIRALGHSCALIVGQGFGAWVGWTLANTHPQMVSGMIGCGAAHPAIFHRNRGFGATVQARWQLRGVRAASRQRRILDHVTAQSGSYLGAEFAASEQGALSVALIRDSLERGALRPAVEHLEWWAGTNPARLRLWLRQLGDPRLAAPRRTALLVGESDTCTPAALVQASCADATVVPKVGHNIALEAPEVLARAIRERLEWLPRYSA